MTSIRWDPFRELEGIQTTIGQVLSDVAQWGASEGSSGSWTPAVDIYEKGDDLVIRAELAGVRLDDIDIRVDKDTLILTGERKEETERENTRSYRRERVFGAFTRRFGLPTSVDANAITARYENGVLEIVLPKLEEAKPRKVRIQAS